MLGPDQFPPHLASLGFRTGTFNHNESRWRQTRVDAILPPLCSVPEGAFLMGSDPERDGMANADEQPQYRVILPAFNIARYPLTVAEFNCYSRAQGKKVEGANPEEPIVDINLLHVTAYADWLTQLTGQRWLVPTEAQWEKAARGADGRIFPWGDHFDESRCNTKESRESYSGLYLDSVGRRPNGASPYGVEDMAGNVWEWTRSLYRPYPNDDRLGNWQPNSTEHCVIRGGSLLKGQESARAACRRDYDPGFLDQFIGARLICATTMSHS